MALNPFKGPGPLDPAGVMSGRGAAGGQFGSFGQILADPLDLFGHRARGTREQIREIQLGSAREGIQAQQEMIDQINQLLGPYRQMGLDYLPALQAMTTGGEANIPLSPQYQLETSRGRKGINQAMAARGLRKSSARGRSLADMLTMAGQNEAARQYGTNLDLQRLATGAIGQMGQAGRQAGANVGSIYGNLGQNLNLATQGYGQQRQQALGGGAQALYGLAQYMQQR